MSIRDSYPEDQIIIHQVSKEDRDLILEYNLIQKREIPKEDFFGIKIDNFDSRNELVSKIIELTENKGVHLVFGVDPYKVMDMRSNTGLKRIVNKASIVYASGAGIPWASRMMNKPIETWVDQISLIVDLIRLSEVKPLPIFFLGARTDVIEQAYFNLKKSFPDMKVVGRHTGFFDNQREKAVLEAIRKTSAKILLVGLGYEREIRWIKRNQGNFDNLVIISVGGSFDIISGKNRKAPDYFTNRGLTWFYRILSRPYRVVAWWRFFNFIIITYYYHFFRSHKKSKNKRR